MHSLLAFALVCPLFTNVVSITISCRNENGSPVDWFINYKLPKLEDRPRSTLLGQGLAYAYLLPNTRTWSLSEVGVSSVESMLGHTLQPFYELKKDLTYLLYNDEPGIEDSGSSVGHTKGIVVFDGVTGFWIIHSIPKFPSAHAYGYPSNGLENGQSVMCITFSIDSLNEIGLQLLYNAPLIYSKNLNKTVGATLDDEVRSLFSNKPNFIRKSPFERTTAIKSLGKLKVTSFAKDNQFNKDLYSDLIAPVLQSSLFVETWRRGSGTRLDAACGGDYEVFDVLAVNLTALENRKTTSIAFSSMQDHSKWAISEGSKVKWICIADINRMESQKRRGGGAVCFVSTSIWRLFNSSIARTDSCRFLS